MITNGVCGREENKTACYNDLDLHSALTGFLLSFQLTEQISDVTVRPSHIESSLAWFQSGLKLKYIQTREDLEQDLFLAAKLQKFGCERHLPPTNIY